MTGNNYVDKVYLALELTKLKYYPLTDNARCYGYGEIYTCFEYFLQKLTNIEDLSIVEEYKKEIENLKKQYLLLSSENQQLQSSCNSSFTPRINAIKKYINDNGGNMEPNVKTQLLKLLDTIFD